MQKWSRINEEIKENTSKIIQQDYIWRLCSEQSGVLLVCFGNFAFITG
jgi:hypothetical protein